MDPLTFVALAVVLMLILRFTLRDPVTGRAGALGSFLGARQPPPWYEATDLATAIRVYPSADLATDDANRAVEHGWAVQSVATSEGHVNLGRTVTGAVVTGGVSLLFGGSRTKGSVTVTYRRGT